jgi:hypothetical protein
MGGFVFESGLVGTDGSSKHSKWPHLASAGSAAYQIDSKGYRRAMRWTLPEGFPLTPAASEMLAFDVVVRSVRPGSTVEILVDCEAVQKCWRDLSWASRAQAKYAGIWKNPIISSTVTMVHKIKSHMSKEQAIASGVSLEWFYLNQEVDIQAGMTLRDYTKADEAWVADVVGRIKRCITVPWPWTPSILLAGLPWLDSPRKRANNSNWSACDLINTIWHGFQNTGSGNALSVVSGPLGHLSWENLPRNVFGMPVSHLGLTSPTSCGSPEFLRALFPSPGVVPVAVMPRAEWWS